MPGLKQGRPALFNNCLDMACMCELYFEDCKEREVPYTIAGLAYFLGFNDRHAISRYGDKHEFSSIIKKAVLRIEQDAVERVSTGKVNPGGIIFILKNHYGYVDKQTIDQTVDDKRKDELSQEDIEDLRRTADKMRERRLRLVK